MKTLTLAIHGAMINELLCAYAGVISIKLVIDGEPIKRPDSGADEAHS